MINSNIHYFLRTYINNLIIQVGLERLSLLNNKHQSKFCFLNRKIE